MSRLQYLEEMVRKNKEHRHDPCAEPVSLGHKCPCFDDLANEAGVSTLCDTCSMGEYQRWFTIIEDLESCPELKPY